MKKVSFFWIWGLLFFVAISCHTGIQWSSSVVDFWSHFGRQKLGWWLWTMDVDSGDDDSGNDPLDALETLPLPRKGSQSSLSSAERKHSIHVARACKSARKRALTHSVGKARAWRRLDTGYTLADWLYIYNIILYCNTGYIVYSVRRTLYAKYYRQVQTCTDCDWSSLAIGPAAFTTVWQENVSKRLLSSVDIDASRMH